MSDEHDDRPDLPSGLDGFDLLIECPFCDGGYIGDEDDAVECDECEGAGWL